MYKLTAIVVILCASLSVRAQINSTTVPLDYQQVSFFQVLYTDALDIPGALATNPKKLEAALTSTLTTINQTNNLVSSWIGIAPAQSQLNTYAQMTSIQRNHDISFDVVNALQEPIDAINNLLASVIFNAAVDQTALADLLPSVQSTVLTTLNTSMPRIFDLLLFERNGTDKEMLFNGYGNLQTSFNYAVIYQAETTKHHG